MGGQEVLGSFHREEDNSRDLEGTHRFKWGEPSVKLGHELRRAQLDVPNKVRFYKRHGLSRPPQIPKFQVWAAPTKML